MASKKTANKIPALQRINRTYAIMSVVMVSITLLAIGALSYVVIADRQSNALNVAADLDEADNASADVNDSDIDDDFVIDDASITAYDVAITDQVEQ